MSNPLLNIISRKRDNSKHTPLQLRRKCSSANFQFKSKETVIDTLPADYKSLFNQLQGQHFTIAYLQFVTGARINEVLSLKRKDIKPNNVIHLKASKGSRDRFIFVPFINEAYNAENENKETYLFSVSYKQYWLQLRKANLHNILATTTSHSVVTHVFRVLRAKVLTDNQTSDTVVDQREFLNHKSAKSITYYQRRQYGSSKRRYLR